MSARRTLDGCPGPVPDIHVDTHGVAFHLHVVGVHPNALLIIRCDDRGGISAAIATEPPPGRT